MSADSGSLRPPDPEAIREVLSEEGAFPHELLDGELRADTCRYVVKLLAAFDASGREAEEFLVLARRCPACSAELNVQATAAFREAARLFPPAFPLATVQCRHYRHPGGVCGEIVQVRAEDVQRARSR